MIEMDGGMCFKIKYVNSLRFLSHGIKSKIKYIYIYIYNVNHTKSRIITCHSPNGLTHN